VVEKLMAFFAALRNPLQKPSDIQHLDERQDAVEQRLKVLSVESANKAQRVIQARR